jgi:hypothetical protein
MADSDFLRESGYASWLVTGGDVPDDWGGDKKLEDSPDDLRRDEQLSRNVIRNCMLRFRCPLKWESLELTNDANVRYCCECTRPVHYCHTTVELHKALSEDKCVAIAIVSGLQDNEEDELMGF